MFANFTLALFMLNNKKLGEHVNIYIIIIVIIK
jgi:hypothetical protein